MPPRRTARERVRAEITREITDVARAQLAADGAAALSLRAVARELGMVSSAVYRYFASRDELLTALIIDGYNALGAAVEQAAAARPRDDYPGPRGARPPPRHTPAAPPGRPAGVFARRPSAAPAAGVLPPPEPPAPAPATLAGDLAQL